MLIWFRKLKGWSYIKPSNNKRNAIDIWFFTLRWDNSINFFENWRIINLRLFLKFSRNSYIWLIEYLNKKTRKYKIRSLWLCRLLRNGRLNKKFTKRIWKSFYKEIKYNYWFSVQKWLNTWSIQRIIKRNIFFRQSKWW